MIKALNVWTTPLILFFLTGELLEAAFDLDFRTPPPVSDFVMRGSATYDAGRKAMRLTEPVGGQAGSFFSRGKVSTRELTVEFTASIGGGSGADGMAFVLASGTAPPLLGGGGGSLGLGGVAGPLLILELDTWGNGPPDAQEADGSGTGNHIGLCFTDTEWDLSSDEWWVPPFPLDDGNPLDLLLHLRMTGETIEAVVEARSEAHSFEWSPILHLRRTSVKFQTAYPGWTAATGGSNNRHLLTWASVRETVDADAFPDGTTHLRDLVYDYYPDLARLVPGDRVFVVRTSQVPAAEEILASTLAGIVARSTPAIYVKGGGDWLPDFAAYGVKLDYTFQANAVGLLGRFKDRVTGYVLYHAGNDSINVATSLSGILDAVAVEESIEGAVSALGLPRRADVRSRDDAWLLDHYSNRFSRGILIQQAESKRQLRDIATLWKALLFFDGNGPLRDRAYDLVSPDSPVFGWGEGGEDSFVGAASQRGLFTIASDFAWNISLHAAVRFDEPLRQRARLDKLPDRGGHVHFVTFMMSDGDNMQWFFNDFITGDKWYGNHLRGSFPMGWTVPPHLVRLAPLIMKHLYDTASVGPTGGDYFVCGVSGGGYLYPSRYPYLTSHTRRLSGYLAAADLDLVTILERERGTFSREYVEPYLREPTTRGLFYLDYGSYAYYRGRVVWSNGKPAVSARFSLWDGQDSPESIAAAIRDLSFDPRSSQAFSYVNVHAWSKSLDDVLATINRLPPGVRVVTPDEFIRQMVRYQGAGPGAWIHVKGFSESDPVVADTGESLFFDGRFSTDPNQDIDRYAWDWNADGVVDGEGPALSRAYPEAGRYIVRLTVTDTGGRSDEADTVVTITPGQRLFKRGDANGDDRVDIADAIKILDYLFGVAGDPEKGKLSACLDVADANDDGGVDIADAIKILDYLFGQTTFLPAPFTTCGADPTADDLECNSYDGCR